MAKEDKGKVRMTVIHFETESDNATLVENIRSIAGTLSKALATPQRLVSAPAQIATTNGKETLSIVEDVTDDDSMKDELSMSAVSSAKKPTKTQPKLRVPQPVDINLTEGSMPLKKFLDDTNPDSDLKKYLAITWWLKKFRSVESVTMDHAYTGYRHMGWQVPKDASAPFRQLKSAKYGWVGPGSTAGSFAINHLGENKVEEMGKTSK
ncbi:hypothetical protein ACYX34_15145 [Nitrospira sp. CMX1]